MSEPDVAAWTRKHAEADLKRWRELEAAYAPNVEREGEVLWFQARERADDCEAKLAILGEHQAEWDDFKDADGNDVRRWSARLATAAESWTDGHAGLSFSSLRLLSTVPATVRNGQSGPRSSA
jgi:hypothetical protein